MQRAFNLGSKWLYYKIYCGVKTADIILLEQLKEKIHVLKEKKIIEKWFFIRYNDPDSHIRLRFLLPKNSDLNRVLETLEEIFEALHNQNLIWKIQTDTYVRELERYGTSSYEVTETIFEADSELILDYLNLKKQFINENTSLLFSFLAIDSLLTAFNLTIQEKVSLLHSMQLSFKQEFNADKNLKKELDKHYRELSNEILGTLERKNLTEYYPLFDVIDFKTTKIKHLLPTVLSNLDVSVFQYLNGQIHMMINRQYSSRQREYELVLYDHLHRFYKTQCFLKS
jgi:thiopeptide-type bacteriocin biosynthesis protein